MYSSSKEAPLLGEEPAPPKNPAGAASLLLLALLVALSVGDSVQGAIMFDRFGEVYAQPVCT